MTVVGARERVRSALGIAAFVLPAAGALMLVLRFGVDVPNWDEWLFVPFLERVAHGQGTLGDWLAPNNEHVVLVPRVLLAALAFTFGWNIWFGLAAGLLFAGAAVLLLRRLSHAVAGPWPLLLAADLATALLLFSLVQWENWLWGMQSAWFLVNLCLVLALVALRPGDHAPGRRRIALAAGACIVATLTTLQGPFTWLGVLPLLVWGGGQPRPRLAVAAAWLGLTGIAGGLLYLGVRQARHAATLEVARQDPRAAAQFLFGQLGAPLATGTGLAVALGVLVALIFLGFAVSGLVARDRAPALPWCVLGFFGLMVAAATAVGRVGFGLDYALSSRYTTNAVLVWVAAWHLVRVRLSALAPRRAGAITGALLVALSAGLVATSRSAIENARIQYLTRAAGKACLELGALLEPTPLNQGPVLYLFMRPAGGYRRFATLVGLGLRPAPPRPSFAAEENPRLGMLTRAKAATGSAAPSGTLTGWAVVEDERHPPILLISLNAGRTFVAAQPLVPGTTPLGVRVRFLTPVIAEWEVPLSVNGPGARGPVSAWRFDPVANVIARLGGAHEGL